MWTHDSVQDPVQDPLLPPTPPTPLCVCVTRQVVSWDVCERTTAFHHTAALTRFKQTHLEGWHFLYHPPGHPPPPAARPSGSGWFEGFRLLVLGVWRVGLGLSEGWSYCLELWDISARLSHSLCEKISSRNKFFFLHHATHDAITNPLTCSQWKARDSARSASSVLFVLFVLGDAQIFCPRSSKEQTGLLAS